MDGLIGHPIARFAVALAIGLIVGVERGWRERDEQPGQRTAGVRTFTLIGCLGAVAGALALALQSGLVLGLAFVAFAGVFGWFTMHEARHDHDFSVTGTVTGLLVFALGAMCLVGDAQVAAAVGVAVAGILASRETVHGLIARLSWPELRSALMLLAMTVIVLPLLPNQPLSWLAGINPREIWLFTVLTATISFAGYIAVKFAGASKGIVVGALAGALVSSTAVTVALARRAAQGEPASILAGGAALAGAVSLLRTVLVALAIAPPLLLALAPAAVAAALAMAAAGLVMVRNGADDKGGAALGNPFELKPLLLFALVFAAVSAISGWLTARWGNSGLFASSAIVALIDVDVATLSAGRLAGGAITPAVAAQAILLALLVNAAARVVYGAIAGPAGFALRLAAATAGAMVIAAAVLLLGPTAGLPA